MNLKSVKLNMLRRGATRLSLLGVLCLALGLSSCNVFDEEQDCLHGIALRFVYDYHMEPGANAFAANVDCINVLVFDENGNYVTQFKETSAALRNDSYRMNLPLENGKYQLMVYGGTACETTRFSLTPDWNTAPAARKGDILVTLPRNEQGESAVQLHNIGERTGGLFYGTLDVELTDDDYNTFYREETVHLMNDVNNIQVIMQEIAAPYQVDNDDFDFQITDDNAVLDVSNNAVAQSLPTTYKPYAAENRITGQANYDDISGSPLTESEDSVQVACAELSTSRLFASHYATARLLITSRKDKDDNGNPKVVIDIPLIEYLLLARGHGDSWIKSNQEFLDRQSRWTLMFFLDNGRWLHTKVSVNSWIVRVNNGEL